MLHELIKMPVILIQALIGLIIYFKTGQVFQTIVYMYTQIRVYSY